jgi:hypothetical protein
MDTRARGRRTLLAATAVFALAWGLPVAAQDPRFSEAQATARAWLKDADANDAAATYANAAARFRSALSQERWTAAMAKTRAEFGSSVRRTIAVTGVPQPGSGTPPGDFVVIRFRSEFEKRPQAVETVTLEREADGKWRVVGYLMR